MLKRLVKDSIIYAAASVFTNAVSFLLLPLYTRILSPKDYGIVDLLGIFATLVNLTIALEISQGVARYFADSQKNPERIAYASTALWFTLGTNIIFVLISWAFSGPIAYILLEPQRQEVLRLAILSTAAYGILYLVQNQLRWQLQPISFAVSLTTATLTSIIASIVFVFSFHLGAEGV